MFEERNSKRVFLSSPPSVPSVVAAFMEPGLAVVTLLFFHAVYHQPVQGPSMVLCLILPVLMFPGVNRFGHGVVSAAIDIVLSWVGVITILFLLGYASGGLSVFDSRLLLGFAVMTPVTHWVGMLIGKAWLRRLALQPQSRRPAVIVGASALGARVAAAIEARRGYGQDLIGFFEDRTLDRVAEAATSRIRGNLDDLPAFIEANGICDVYITLPLSSQPRILRLMESLQNSTASLYFVPDVFGVSIIQGRLEEMSGVPVVGLLVTPFTGLNGLLKRGSDLVLATLILIVISPLLLILAVGVKISSPGPMIFRQYRTGLDGEVIEVYKFRSMTSQDNGDQVAQARRGDARVTRFGAFIRRTSLDELPQFINVLQGRMSIVGPRPHAVAHNQEYRQLVKAYMARHKVKPGITGWAQVNGLRGETDTVEKMARRVEFDLEYLRNWSVGLDLLIILRTIKLMFFDRHAY